MMTSHINQPARKKLPCGSVPYATKSFTPLLVFMIAAVSVLTYGDILQYYFTATDTLTLIKINRIESAADIARMFTEPLADIPGLELNFFRPISSLSYGIDYAIWKLNPFGYHLTNLTLHVLVSVCIFFLVRDLTGNHQIIPFLAAIIFTTHPTLTANVPAIARRQDIIASVFLLLSMWLFIKSVSRNGFIMPLSLLSIFFYAVSLCTKEIAIILPALVFAYSIVFSEKTISKDVALSAFKKSLPFFLITLAYLIWRVHVLGGLGGSELSLNPFKAVIILVRYFSLLLYPLVISSLCSPFIHILTTLIVAFVVIMLVCTPFLEQNNPSSPTRKRKRFSFSYLFLSLVITLSGIGLILSPPEFLQGIIKHSRAYPPGYCPAEARTILPGIFLSIFLLSAVFLAGMSNFKEIKNFAISTKPGRSCLFCLIWLILALAIYLFTLTFSSRCMYVPMIPFSIMIAIALGETFRTWIKDGNVLRIKKSGTSSAMKPIRFAVVLGLSISLLLTSPLITDYEDWKNAGKMTCMYLERVAQIIPTLPKAAILHLYGVPAKEPTYETGPGKFLAEHNIKSWIDLNFPDNHMRIAQITYTCFDKVPESIDMDIKLDGNRVEIIAGFK